MMFMEFSDWRDEIRNYCENNSLDFEKARKSPHCCSNDTIWLQDYDRNDKTTPAIIDSTPAPITLIITKSDNGISFTQTEHTLKYLSAY